MDKIKENKVWICPICKVEWNKEANYCRKCSLKERIAKRRAKYLGK